MTNPHLDLLQPYPFEKLNAIKSAVKVSTDKAHIALSIGEPKHQYADFIEPCLAANSQQLSYYPSTKGTTELRAAIANWATKRFNLQSDSLNPDSNVLPVNGTREALFAFTQTVVDAKQDALVVSPNPFYQIYEGAALIAGAQPHFLACEESNHFIPDFDNVPADVWQRCQLLFLCSPGNPTGAVVNSDTLKKLIALADQYDFIIASDECYSELYFDEQNPPTGLLEACAELGRNDYKHCVVFHSLSKRSNLPGLRSGFIAGDAELLKAFLLYRTYHGCAMPLHHQNISIAAWQDEQHVKANRDLYREKFSAVLDILGGSLDVSMPDASFYLWAKTPISDIDFAQQLFVQQHVTVLPGQYLSRTVDGNNPGENRIRMALVAELEECIEAAKRIKEFVNAL